MITNKPFQVNHGINVVGNAKFDSGMTFDNIKLDFDTETNRLKLYSNGNWYQIAKLSDTESVNFQGLRISVNYEGNS